MAYDKKTSTISIASDDPKDFERDLLSHFAHVTEQVESDIATSKLIVPAPPAPAAATSMSKTPMTWIALVLNCALLFAVIFLLLDRGAPSGGGDIALVLLLLAAPIASLVALGLRHGDTLLSLYLKRKALEEQQRIKQLESK